ncbi:outer membrane beta-barrel family protein [Flavobacterium sp. '19STA2R22 D10 B1']|uniref:outer membrane beta-barrel family protein n=1 Tax=Flavobacterium aerium TaxID=3037261 RepID=UPI00278C20A6|nr:outer membrane beta-barrel family protein [Flavobacterium sp. '19STA2R22 D10 B1']
MRIIVILFFCFCLNLFGTFKTKAQQLTLSGIVQEKIKQPLEYGEVILYKKADSTIVRSTQTDLSGKFSLNAIQGDYKLKIFQFGKLFHSQNISLLQNLDLGILTIENKAEELNEVVVTGKKQLIERKIDRVVFNVENSIASQGMDATEALKNTPLLKVDETNGVSIVGKSGVSVMINDKMINLSGNELMNYLQSLRSDNIAKIEVITTPPAKYDAQGNSGIINIVLKKNQNIGWSGNASTTYIRKSRDGFSNTAVLNYQSSKLSTSLRLRQYDTEKKAIERTSFQGDNSVFSVDRRLDMNDGVGVNFSLDYKLTERSKIGFVYDHGRTHSNMNINNSSIYKTLQTQDSLLTTTAKHRYTTPSHTLNVYYDISLDTLGKKLSFSGNYFSNISESNINFNTLNTNTTLPNVIYNYSKIDYNILSGQADLELPYKWAKVEAGSKYTIFKNSSDIQYFDFLNENYILDPSKSNLFNYNEQNIAGYISLSSDINEHWSVKGGLRYEHSIIEGKIPLTDVRTKNEYGKWFPSMYISYKVNPDHIFSVNYSRRISRPFFRAINPYRWYINQYSYATGNPLLRPAYDDNFELGYSYKGKLSFTLYYQASSNNYGQVVTFEDGIKIINYLNYFDEYNIGTNIYYNDTFFSIWEAGWSTSIYYNETKGLSDRIVGQHSFSFYYTLNNTITINEKKTTFLLLNFWQGLPYARGNTQIKGSYSFSPGLKMSFLDKKLNVSAVFRDVFKSDKGRGTSTYDNAITTFNNYYDSRTFTLSVNYSFGNTKVKGANKNVKFDEKNRAN